MAIRVRVRVGHVCNGETRAAAGNGNGNYSDCIRVIYDPDEDGGFSPGALLTKMEAMSMLNMCSFTEGTIVYIPGHGELTVVTYTHYNGRGGSRERQAFKGQGFKLIAPYDPCGRALIKRMVIA